VEVEGSSVNPVPFRKYLDPALSVEDYFQLEKSITIEELFKARVHYGHKIGTLEGE